MSSSYVIHGRLSPDGRKCVVLLATHGWQQFYLVKQEHVHMESPLFSPIPSRN